jgi:hypothetical protein
MSDLVLGSLKKIEPSPKEIIDALEKIIRSAEGASVANEKSELGNGCKYEHAFTDGIYIRKMFIPRDLLIVTKVHKTRHPYFIMYGDVSVYLDGVMVRLKAPFSGVTEPGTRRALRTHEDTLWITVHATDKTEVEAISKDVVVDTVDEYEEWKRRIDNQSNQHSLEQKDA